SDGFSGGNPRRSFFPGIACDVPWDRNPDFQVGCPIPGIFRFEARSPIRIAGRYQRRPHIGTWQAPLHPIAFASATRSEILPVWHILIPVFPQAIPEAPRRPPVETTETILPG